MPGYLLLAFAQIVVGVSIVGAKYLIATMPVIFLLTIRFFIATAILFLLSLLTESQKQPLFYLKQLSRKSWCFIFAQAVTAGVMFNLLMLWGLHYTTASIAGIIGSTLPAILAILFWLFLREKLTLTKWLCIGFATIGLIIVNMVNTTAGLPSSSALFGAILVFLSLIPEATYYILNKAHVIKLPVFLISSIINGINAFLLLPAMLLLVDWPSFEVSAFQMLILGVVSLASGLFYVFWFLGADKASSSAASLSTALMPISTVLIAWAALGEEITMWQFVGMCLVIVSIVVGVIAKEKPGEIVEPAGM